MIFRWIIIGDDTENGGNKRSDDDELLFFFLLKIGLMIVMIQVSKNNNINRSKT